MFTLLNTLAGAATTWRHMNRGFTASVDLAQVGEVVMFGRNGGVAFEWA